jgi:hypothetical protein
LSVSVLYTIILSTPFLFLLTFYFAMPNCCASLPPASKLKGLLFASITGLGGRGLFGPALTLCITGAAVRDLLFPPPIFNIAGKLSRLDSLGMGETSAIGLGMVSAIGLGILVSFSAPEGVGGRSLNSGTVEEIRWRFTTEGGFEVKARLMGSLTWRFGSTAGVAMAERSLLSLLLALLETLE